MLNRNDRNALKRNRNAVSWLVFLCIALGIWIKTLYSDIGYMSSINQENRTTLIESQRVCQQRQRTIDSLLSVINYKPVDTAKSAIKPYKVVKKDSLKVDTTTKQTISVKPTKNDTILKDSLKLK